MEARREELCVITHATAMRSRKGEDKHSHIDSGELSCFLVADGHGGPLVAEYASVQVLEHIRRANPDDSTIGAVMHDAFVRVHSEVKDPAFKAAGTTCTVVAVNRRTRLLTCANVGDSQSFLVLPAGPVTPLSVDHRLEANLEERERIVSSGGRLGRASAGGLPGGPLRVWPGGLAMSRALGDPDCEGSGVVAEPSVSQVQLPPEGGRVVLCSDGVWDALSVEKVAKCLRKAANPAAAAEKVVARAIKARGLRDDTTCTVAAVGSASGQSTSSSPDLGWRFSPSGMRRHFSFGSMTGMGRAKTRNSGDGDGSSSDSDCSLDPDDSGERDPTSPSDASPSTPRKLFGGGDTPSPNHSVKGGRLFGGFASRRGSSAATPPQSPELPHSPRWSPSQGADGAQERAQQGLQQPHRPSSMWSARHRSPDSSQHGGDGALPLLPEHIEGGVRSISVDCSAAPTPGPATPANDAGKAPGPSTNTTVESVKQPWGTLWKSPGPE